MPKFIRATYPIFYKMPTLIEADNKRCKGDWLGYIWLATDLFVVNDFWNWISSGNKQRYTCRRWVIVGDWDQAILANWTKGNSRE